MTATAVPRRRGTGRAHLHDVALRLFARDGVEGTPLQAIADEMGVSKAAVYHHYKTKEELVVGVLAPLLAALPALLDEAEAQRGRPARAEALVTGLARLAVEHHARFAVIMQDPYVARVLSEQHAVREGWERMVALVSGPAPDPQARMAILMFATGLPTTLRDPAIAAMDADEVQAYLIECGRRLLGLRRRAAS